MQSLWMLAASFLFALMAGAVKLASADIGTFTLVFYRGLFGIVILGAWCMATGRSLKTKYTWGHVKRSVSGTVALAMWLYCLAFLPLSTGTTLNYTSPLFMSAILVAAAFLYKRPVEWKLVLACIVGFVGVVEVLQPEFRSGDLVPALVGLGSGLCSAIAYIQIKQLSQFHEPDWRVVFYFSICNAVFGLVGHLLFEKPDVYTVQSILCIVVVGVSATVAQLMMTRSFSAGNLLLSSILSFSGIVFACIFGVFFFGDVTTFETYIGIAIIIVAGATASVVTKRAGKVQQKN
ncbi:MAG: DMT family transporter [Sutterellaceae bacterium]|nr:DMT family transporter [Sutterellaceae bacterium]